MPRLMSVMISTFVLTAAAPGGSAVAEELELINPGAEAGDLSGWGVAASGDPIESTDSVQQTSGLVTPYAGDAFFSFAAEPGTTAALWQDVFLPRSSRRVRLDGWCQTEFGDIARATIVFFDGNGLPVAQTDTGPLVTSDLSWEAFSLTRTGPSDAVSVRLELEGTLVAGTFMNVFYDELSLHSVDPGDVDGDGTVGLVDLLAILAGWGACEDCPEDLDADGEVSFSDLLAVLAGWA